MGNEPAQRDAGQRGRYVLGELLGRGGMGEVFAGYAFGSHGFQKPVAIKRIVRELADDETFVDRLIGEAKLLVGMQHSNIVSVLDLTREGGDVFLVMEFVDGPSLHQLLKARGPRKLPFGISSHIIQSAAAGLQFAHARKGGGIIHADISPGNLLLSMSGEVRVADFGIAQREGRAGGAEGKWAYMSPEQLRGEPLTPRCDVFSLGLVLYELLTLRHPLGLRVTPEKRVDAPHHIIPPRVLNPEIPLGLDALCMRALAEDPAERVATMQELLDGLVDQRFKNDWREGASELAKAIQEVSAFSQRQGHTSRTGQPVTLATKSLIGASDPPFAPEGSDASTGLFAVDGEPETPTPRTPDNEPTSEAAPILPTGPTRVIDLGDLESTVGRPPIALPDPRNRKLLVLATALAATAAGVLIAVVSTSTPAKHARRIATISVDAAIDAPPAPDADIDAAAPTIAIDAASEPPPDAPDPTAVVEPVPKNPKVERSKRPAPPPPPQTGWLRVTTADGAWAKATLRAESFDMPGASFKLKPGTNTVTVKDATRTRTCVVPFKPGSQTLTVAMKSGSCVVR